MKNMTKHRNESEVSVEVSRKTFEIIACDEGRLGFEINDWLASVSMAINMMIKILDYLKYMWFQTDDKIIMPLI